MKRYILTLLFLILIALVVVPVSAVITPEFGQGTGNYTSSYNSTSYFHDKNYIPLDILYLFILIAFVSWIISVFSPICEDLFALVSPISFAAAAWYSAYVSQESIRVVSVVANGVGEIYTIHTEIITPLPGLQIAMTLCLILSILSMIYIIFLRKVDRSLERKRPEGVDK
jgi:hypothetical protein